MAKMVGVWIYVHPRRRLADDVVLTFGATVLMSEAEVRKIGLGLLPVDIQIRDRDFPGFDDRVHIATFHCAAQKVGPNHFHTEVTVPHSEVEDSEPWFERTAELYARLRGNSTDLSTNWANSQMEHVRFK
jgi:hypothetical protein